MAKANLPGNALLVLLLLLTAVPAMAADEGTVRIHLIWTNDMHGYVDPRGATFMNPDFPPPLGGGASAARYVEQLRASLADDPDAGVLLVDAGDTWQGSPVGTLTEGRVMEVFYDQMGYDVVIPGNHEFDKGKRVPIRMSGAMKKPLVCANIFDAQTGEIVDWLVPYRVIERAGLRIGVIGVTTPSTAEMAFDENIAGLRFGPMVEALEHWRDVLLEEEKVDVVFAAVHDGLPYDAEEGWADLQARVARGEDIRANVHGAMDLAHVIENIPVMVGGHTHRGYDHPWIDPVTHTMVFESYGNGSSIGHAVILVDRATGQVLGYDTPRRESTLVTLFEDEWWPEENMVQALKPHLDEAQAGLSQVVGRSSVMLTRRGRSNSPMGNLVTEAMREALEADWAFSNTGGLRTDLPRGEITEGDLLTLLPFGNSLVAVQMSGRTVREVVERKAGKRSSGLFQSGATIVVDPLAERGQRVLEMTIGGEPLDPDRMYRVATVDFLMEGNSGLDFLAQIPPDQSEYTGVLTRDAVKRYLQRHSPVSPRVDERFREEIDGEMAPYLRGWTLP